MSTRDRALRSMSIQTVRVSGTSGTSRTVSTGTVSTTCAVGGLIGEDDRGMRGPWAHAQKRRVAPGIHDGDGRVGQRTGDPRVGSGDMMGEGGLSKEDPHRTGDRGTNLGYPPAPRRAT